MRITSIEYLRNLPDLPVALKHGQGKTVYGRPSNAELNRWLNSGAVIINGRKPKPLDEIELPITELVFFPSSIRKTTIIKED